jgi:ribosomal-protein-alanine N-acetyltransferase
MTYRVRKMRWEDIEQVLGIDLLCFPTMLPPPNYKTEFVNPMAHYLVACDDSNLDDAQNPENQKQSILGFIGLWYMADEIHVINLAVHPDFRHQGIGELLLIHAIELSIQLKAILITLEVRVSNLEAQALYTKYGFSERGIRRAYYLDNREDAVIMTLDGMFSADYQATFQKLKRDFAIRRKISLEGTAD